MSLGGIRVPVKDKTVWRTLDSKPIPKARCCCSAAITVIRPKSWSCVRENGRWASPCPRDFVTAHVNPGDKVSFRVMTLAASRPNARCQTAGRAAGRRRPAAVAAGTAELQPKPEEPEIAAPDRRSQ